MIDGLVPGGRMCQLSPKVMETLDSRPLPFIDNSCSVDQNITSIVENLTIMFDFDVPCDIKTLADAANTSTHAHSLGGLT